MPDVNIVPDVNKLPPVAASYHFIDEAPAILGTKLATVAPEQKDCDAVPVGAGEDVIVTEKG